MAKFSIMLFGIDSYMNEKLYLPYNLEAKKCECSGPRSKETRKERLP